MLSYRNIISLWIVISYVAANQHQRPRCPKGSAITCMHGGKIDGKDYVEIADPARRGIEKGGFGTGEICWDRTSEFKCCASEIRNNVALTDADGHRYITPDQAAQCRKLGPK
ncbi:hypothetical protein PGT21_021853 [Puccinia graminis f. sp. tritici]|uniref:Uncharacterized protein n=1 Tax=Puccinia graminis f. sp. tritici TaxID=56615 RepID=A0A5B0QBI2_PUCGR|nr:hypothetical protein PGT21_021853 [Puccinia graminis f. sp. tritici]KAA1134843.1 hypothetical protein PGTUg99_003290 [Puccinia graminis f. sp. tritici]